MLLTAPFRYGYSARATADFWLKNGWGRFEFKRGEEFYGVPFAPPLATGVRGATYCSPRTVEGRSWASCVVLLKGQPVTGMSTSDDPYLVSRFTANFQSAEGSALALDRVADAYAGALGVRLRLTRHTATSLELSTEIVRNDVVVSTMMQKAKLKGGAVELVFGQGRLRVVIVNDGLTATLVSPIAYGDSVMFQIAKPGSN